MKQRPSRREKERKIRRGYAGAGSARRVRRHGAVGPGEKAAQPRVTLEAGRERPGRWCALLAGRLGARARVPARRWHEVYEGWLWGRRRRGGRWRGRQSLRSRTTDLEDAGRRRGTRRRWRGRERGARWRGGWEKRRGLRGVAWWRCRWGSRWGAGAGVDGRVDAGVQGLRGARERERRRRRRALTQGRRGGAGERGQ